MSNFDIINASHHYELGKEPPLDRSGPNLPYSSCDQPNSDLICRLAMAHKRDWGVMGMTYMWAHFKAFDKSINMVPSDLDYMFLTNPTLLSGQCGAKYFCICPLSQTNLKISHPTFWQWEGKNNVDFLCVFLRICLAGIAVWEEIPIVWGHGIRPVIRSIHPIHITDSLQNQKFPTIWSVLDLLRSSTYSVPGLLQEWSRPGLFYAMEYNICCKTYSVPLE